MFYHEFVLAKKGTLGKVWLAAHWEKKLSRSAIAKHDVVNSCKSIIEPVTPLALRTSGHLLLGVVRIHDGKAKDLMTDCSNALCQIKRAFTPGVDASTVKTTATHAAITLGEGDQIDADELPEYIDANDSTFTAQANMGRADEITMPAENDFMEADYAAPDMGEAFAEEFPDGVPFYGDQEQPEHDEIEQGRRAIPDAEVSAIETFNDTVDHTVDTTYDQGPQDEFVPPDFADEIPLDETANTTVGGAADATFGNDDVDPHFADATPVRQANDTRVENITLESLEPSGSSLTKGTPGTTTARSAGSSSFSLGRRRKLIVDAKTEISSDAMRAGLEVDGPNDITRQPYSPETKPLAFSRPAPTRAALRRQLRDSSMEARYARPLTLGGRWKGKALKAWQSGLKNTLKLPEADNAAEEDDIEMGRRAPNDDSTYQLDETAAQEHAQPPEFEDEVPQYEPEAFNPVDETVDQEQVSLGASAMGGPDATFGSDDPSMRQSRYEEEEEEEEIPGAEGFEADHLTRRTVKMINSLRLGFENVDELSYNDMTRNKSRRTAAACLFELLVLKTKDYIEIEQSAPFADITVTPTAQLQEAISA
eukprot:m.76277 g.76277  ORF g.76277 m.76277 type:complete len:594 (+) comp9049_c0_seq2:93-1874(+)